MTTEQPFALDASVDNVETPHGNWAKHLKLLLTKVSRAVDLEPS
jgi:hypothetical protein